MQEENLYLALQLHNYFDGGASLYRNLKVDLNSKSEIRAQLDSICLSKNFIPLQETWKEISMDAFKNLLQKALHFNIGFLNDENMSFEESTFFYQQLTNHFEIDECLFFTNWHNDPWNSKNTSIAANTVSDATLDLVLSVIHHQKLLFFYVLFED